MRTLFRLLAAGGGLPLLAPPDDAGADSELAAEPVRDPQGRFAAAPLDGAADDLLGDLLADDDADGPSAEEEAGPHDVTDDAFGLEVTPDALDDVFEDVFSGKGLPASAEAGGESDEQPDAGDAAEGDGPAGRADADGPAISDRRSADRPEEDPAGVMGEEDGQEDGAGEAEAADGRADPPAFDLLAAAREAFPEEVIETPEQLFEKHRSLRDDAAAMRRVQDGLADVFERAPAALGLVEYLAQHPEATVEDALLATLDTVELVGPDPATDPEGYERTVEARARQAERERVAAEEATRRQERLDLERARLVKLATAFKEQHGLGEEGAAAFFSAMARYVEGDPETGARPADLFDVFHFGLNREALLEQAREEGLVEGRRQALEDMKRRQSRASGASPRISGSGAPAGDRRRPAVDPEFGSILDTGEDFTDALFRTAKLQ